MAVCISGGHRNKTLGISFELKICHDISIGEPLKGETVGRAAFQFVAANFAADRMLYKWAVRETLENQPNLSLFQQEADDLIVDNQRIGCAP